MKPYYDEDGISIYHGDCLDVLKSLGLQFDLVLWDPPYNMGFDYGPETDDERSDYRQWMERRLDVIQWSMKDGAQLYMNQPTRNLPVVMPLLPECRLLAWCKNFSQIWPSPWNWGSWEPVIYWAKGKPGIVNKRNAADKDRDWYITRGALGLVRGKPQKSSHPCPKPPEAALPLIARSANNGSMILDPMCGSGAYLVAAKLSGCRAVGIEISEAFCECAAKGLSQGVLFGAA